MKLQPVNLPSGFSEEITNKIKEKGIKSCFYMIAESGGEDIKRITEFCQGVGYEGEQGYG